MKILVLYRPNSEQARPIEEFVRDLQGRGSRVAVQLMDVDSREGAEKAALYDILQFPAILVLRDDNTLQQLWLGDQLPLIDEVLGYATA